MPTLSRTLAGVMLVVASALTGASCNESALPVTAQRVDGTRVEWDRRRANALAEIARLGPEHPWAGEYSFTLGEPGTSNRLILAPLGGCVAASPSCSDLNDNIGTVVEKDEVLQVTFERPSDPTNPYGFHTEYTVHGTGSDRYLREVLLPGEPWGRLFERDRPSAQTIVRGER